MQAWMVNLSVGILCLIAATLTIIKRSARPWLIAIAIVLGVINVIVSIHAKNTMHSHYSPIIISSIGEANNAS